MMKFDDSNSPPESIDRREFVKQSTLLASAGLVGSTASAAILDTNSSVTKIEFPATDSLVHPPEWESLNPGFWKVEDGRLRRRLSNVGDRARNTGFPFHYESKGNVMKTA